MKVESTELVPGLGSRLGPRVFDVHCEHCAANLSKSVSILYAPARPDSLAQATEEGTASQTKHEAESLSRAEQQSLSQPRSRKEASAELDQPDAKWCCVPCFCAGRKEGWFVVVKPLSTSLSRFGKCSLHQVMEMLWVLEQMGQLDFPRLSSLDAFARPADSLMSVYRQILLHSGMTMSKAYQWLQTHSAPVRPESPRKPVAASRPEILDRYSHSLFDKWEAILGETEPDIAPEALHQLMQGYRSSRLSREWRWTHLEERSKGRRAKHSLSKLNLTEADCSPRQNSDWDYPGERSLSASLLLSQRGEGNGGDAINLTANEASWRRDSSVGLRLLGRNLNQTLEGREDTRRLDVSCPSQASLWELRCDEAKSSCQQWAERWTRLLEVMGESRLASSLRELAEVSRFQ